MVEIDSKIEWRKIHQVCINDKCSIPFTGKSRAYSIYSVNIVG